MTAEYKLEGADKLREVSRALRKLGDKELSREFARRQSRILKPLKAALKEPSDKLPKRYARELAGSLKLSTRRSSSRRNPGLRVTGRANTPKGKERDLSSLNRGRLRKPLFGNRRYWYDQKVPANWWDDKTLQQKRQVRKEIEELVDDFARKIEREIS